MPRFTTELRETGYIAEADLRAKLIELFGQKEFHISTRSERWTYRAPRKLTPEELKTILKMEAET